MDETLILLADGSRESAESIKNLLEGSGFRNIIFAETPEECLKSAAEFNPQLLVIDFDLGEPGGGLETLKAIRKKQTVPVVFLAGSSDEAMISLAHETEPCVYIKKPVSLIDIYSGVHSLLARIRAEAMLREREKLFKDLVTKEKKSREYLAFQAMILDQIGERITVTDFTGRIIYINEAVSRAFGLSKQEIIGNSTEFYGDDPCRGGTQHQILTEALEKGEWSGEVVNIAPDGRELLMDCSVRMVKNPDGTPRALCGIARDITDKKAAENMLRESLAEKEILLKEIHHRVKNNLQIIVSLLNLQSGHITDPEALQSYEDSQTRIRAMALIHENLYQSGSFSKILFGEYIKSLTADIYSSYRPADRSITLDFDLDEIFITMDRAIPCALILNELLTNAFKYAFPPAFSGVPRICISLKELPDENNLILEVADNGVGITSGVRGVRAGSFGMTLVSLMTAQIKGNYSAVSDRGVKAVLVFGKK